MHNTNKEFNINSSFSFFKRIRTCSLIILLVQKSLCVSISRGKPSIYFLLNIVYVVYVVYVVVVVYAVYVQRVDQKTIFRDSGTNEC